MAQHDDYCSEALVERFAPPEGAAADKGAPLIGAVMGALLPSGVLWVALIWIIRAFLR